VQPHPEAAPPDQKHGRLYMAFERGFDAWKRAYDLSLRWALARRFVVLLAFGLVCFVTGTLFYFAPKGFLPSEDSGQLFCFVEGPQDISFEAMAELQGRVTEIIRKDPNVEAAMSFVGATGFSPSLNRGRITITLKPFKERKPADQVVRELRPKLASVLGAKVFLQNVPAIRIGGQLTQSPYQYVVRSTNIDELYQWAPAIEQKMRSLPMLVDVASDLQITRPQVTVEIEREKAAALGVSVQSIELALNNAYGSRQVSTIYSSTNQYWVILELAPRYQTDPSVILCSTCDPPRAPSSHQRRADSLAWARRFLTTASSPRSPFRSICGPAWRCAAIANSGRMRDCRCRPAFRLFPAPPRPTRARSRAWGFSSCCRSW
jgi:HAE1 family hydrophobic/amphiphilic exporter-1